MAWAQLALLSRNGFRTTSALTPSIYKCRALGTIWLFGEVAAWDASPILHECKIHTFIAGLLCSSSGTTQAGLIIIIKVVSQTTGAIDKSAKMLTFNARLRDRIKVLVWFGTILAALFLCPTEELKFEAACFSCYCSGWYARTIMITKSGAIYRVTTFLWG